jgi:hypothetical protein
MEAELASIRAVLVMTPPRWSLMVASLPGDLLARRPLPDQWSALDCLRHLVETERVLYPVRVRQFLAGQPFDPFDADESAARAADEAAATLMAQFSAMREASLALIDSLTAEDLARTNQHPKLGEVTLRQMLHTWAAHDLNHTVQAERALMQPFIAGCGPWRSFFVDHAVASNA